ncbi:TetR/AcrR family transcriptional regulator [Cohnella thailandensis]|uniref:TetR/AcrR family transcriptional regulator n=1 Tax=Cohnella thailandensis TaxID=557557 RepID=A0A841SQ45_9BACL|nr:TetR/AcrR family transcriptional regulator [Cohnella thailandensis]MBB6632969.1 TetR/AcrR family transcriptional regulator [Cohnella thailandensis]MBP1975337.1 AcrR family transcriptional regulator [Cohnella thailandensis]
MGGGRRSERNLRHEQAAETREKLLATAKTLFAQKGYHGTPVRAINREIGMADGILYHYFPGGKREMLTVMLHETFDKLGDMIREVNDEIEKLPLKEALEVISNRVLKLFLDDENIMRILFREHDVLDIEGTDLLSKVIAERHAWFASMLERRHERGEIRKMDFLFAAKQFISMNLLYVISSVIGINFTGTDNREDYRRRVIEHTVNLWKNP